MVKPGLKSIISLIAVIALCTCIDPYSPRLRGYESLLVVDGLITDENTSYTVKLSRTIQEQTTVPVRVSDAEVSITDGNGNSYGLKSEGEGIYKTEMSAFKGIIGKSYTLHIATIDGKEYESEAAVMLPVPEIDSIYFVKDQELINNGAETRDGLMIFLNSKKGVDNEYFRWDFDETWKFRIPDPKKYDYVNDSTIIPVTRVNEYCWKNKKSEDVIIHSVYSGESAIIKNQPIYFIDPDKSERLLIQYSILVRQYSISKKEYDFWDNMKMVNASGSDIFASQPFPVISNIHNINNPDEQVLGYFQVSAVKQMRKNIAFSDIVKLNLPYFNYPCIRIEMAPEDYPWSPYSVPLTWDDLYDMYCKKSDYSFIEPRFIPGTSKLEKLVFSKPECADCEITGTSLKPDFWIDLN